VTVNPRANTGTSTSRDRSHGPTKTSTSSPGTGTSAAQPRIRDYKGGDETALVEIYSTIFRPRTLDEWRWLFENAPSGRAQILVIEFEGRPVGCGTHVPVEAWVDGSRLQLAIGCDMMLLPEYRGRGWMRLLYEAFVASEHGFDIDIGVVSDASAHITGRYGGNATLGAISLWMRHRTRGRRLPAAAGAALSVAERSYGAVTSWPRPRLSFVDLENPGSDVDQLAEDSAAFALCIRIRDADYLRWHWLEQPGARWRIRGVRTSEGRLRGLAVLGPRDESHGRSGWIVELLAHDYATTRALLLDAYELLVRDGCRSVACAYHDPRPWGRRVLYRSGFRPTEGPRLACGALSNAAGPVVENLDSWYLTCGDTDI
jgi:GNAT superfamily N-acetyltransferase